MLIKIHVYIRLSSRCPYFSCLMTPGLLKATILPTFNLIIRSFRVFYHLQLKRQSSNINFFKIKCRSPDLPLSTLLTTLQYILSNFCLIPSTLILISLLTPLLYYLYHTSQRNSWSAPDIRLNRPKYPAIWKSIYPLFSN